MRERAIGLFIIFLRGSLGELFLHILVIGAYTRGRSTIYSISRGILYPRQAGPPWVVKVEIENTWGREGPPLMEVGICPDGDPGGLGAKDRRLFLSQCRFLEPLLGRRVREPKFLPPFTTVLKSQTPASDNISQVGGRRQRHRCQVREEVLGLAS